MVPVTQLKAAMLRQAREAAQEHIVSFCSRWFALELVQAGLHFLSGPEQSFETASNCPGTRMGEACYGCMASVEACHRRPGVYGGAGQDCHTY
jgi:hypothetical protein